MTIKDEENGLTYVQLGDYLVPNLVSEMKPVYGKYAEMRFRFLKSTVYKGLHRVGI